jgi:hypothetical protein
MSSAAAFPPTGRTAFRAEKKRFLRYIPLRKGFVSFLLKRKQTFGLKKKPAGGGSPAARGGRQEGVRQ